MNNNLDRPFYYLENFAFVLDWVKQRYGDLLDAEENAFLAQFEALPETARGLLVRMVMRKGSIFKTTKLQYDEIGDTRQVLLPLVAAGLVEADPVLSLAQLYALLTRNEFAGALGLGGARAARKVELFELANADEPEARRFSLWCGALDEQAWELKIDGLCDRFRLMFFGNLYQDWSEFVLSDLGIFSYEKVEFSLASRAFHSRADIDFYLHCHACRERFHAGELEHDDAESIVAGLRDIENDLYAYDNDNRWLQDRRSRLLFQIAQRHEQLEQHAAALQAYARSAYPGARLRRIRILEKERRIAEALALAQEALLAPENASESQHLERSLPRLHRKSGLPRLPPATRLPVTETHLVLPQPTEAFYVEEVARAHYAQADAASQVYYVENGLINSLFGLLCWDAIFHAVPGAFFHPFQSGPADLHGADFSKVRAAQFEACLNQLENEAYRDTILRNFARKTGLQSPFVFWSMLDEDLLMLALDCMPAKHLAHWFARILQDIAANRTGFPDLIQFWPQERRYRMIEVKGPGDRLQDNQLRLIDFAQSHGMPLEVCYIAWQESA